MGPLRSSRPRLRALVVTLAALAATAVAAPGTASAEVPGLITVQMSASCDHPSSVVFTRIKCGATVRNPFPIVGAPTGQLRLLNEGIGAGAFPTGRSRCTLQPVAESPNSSTCSVVYETRRLGLQLLDIAYLGDAIFDPAADEIPLIALKGVPTATVLTCQKVNFGETGRCLITVRDAEGNSRPPSGIVSFSSIPIGAAVEFSSFSCQLQQLSLNASRCTIDYRPAKPGSWVFRASYEGSAVFHAPSTGETAVTVKPPVNAP
jgi:hypothetical protein